MLLKVMNNNSYLLITNNYIIIQPIDSIMRRIILIFIFNNLFAYVLIQIALNLKSQYISMIKVFVFI